MSECVCVCVCVLYCDGQLDSGRMVVIVMVSQAETIALQIQSRYMCIL